MSSFKLNAVPQLHSTTADDEHFSISAFLNMIERQDRILCLVASTYRLHLPWVMEQFKTIFAHGVPTLIVHGSRNLHLRHPLPASLRLEEVVPHLPLVKDRMLSRGIDRGGLHDDEQDVEGNGKALPGTHHAKYLMVFVEGGLWLAITSANLAPHAALDGTWHHFFPSIPTIQQNNSRPIPPTNDFGGVLEDFISHQSKQMRRNLRHPAEFNIISWIRSFVGDVSLALSYDFSSADVALVSTVPGRFTFSGEAPSLSFDRCIVCAAEAKCTQPSKFKYGLERMRALIGDMELKSSSPEERLYLQPTSIGAITQAYMAEILMHLMPERYWDASYLGQLRQESYRILWPSSDFMRGCSNPQHQSSDSYEELGGLFLDPSSLAAMEPDIHSQMFTYRAVAKYQCVSPHIKTYLRLLRRRVFDEGERQCSCVSLLWCLLSSACLSAGSTVLCKDIHLSNIV